MPKNNRIPFAILAAASSLIFLFNNCGQDVHFRSPTESVSTSPGVTGTEPEIDQGGGEDEVREIKSACESGDLEKKSYQVVIPDPGTTCAWGEGGNLDVRNGYTQARIEQDFSFDLPEGSKICGLSFDFEEQPFLYDDHFLFTFNEVVLASSYDFSDRFLRSGDLHLYQWDSIAGLQMDTSREGIFCADTKRPDEPSLCSWPRTDHNGIIFMEFPDSLIQEIMALDSERFTHAFTMITTGDNNDRDCEHSDIRFTFKVNYVVD